VGKEFGDQVQISAGLDDGQTVVVGSPAELRDGQPVKIAGGA
jgi:hypothetical protein